MPGERRFRTRAAIASLVVALAFGAMPVGAAPSTNVDGYVIAMEGDDVIVDIGTAKGIAVGDVIELWHPIEIVHPVTHQHVRDRYRVGTLRLVQVRDRMGVASLEKSKRPPQPGDGVVWRREPEAPPAPRVATPPAAAGAASAPTPVAAPSAVGKADSAAALSAEAIRVSELFDSLRDASLVDRIRAYVAYVRLHPDSPFARVLHEDAIRYHRLFRAQQRGTDSGEAATAPSGAAAASPAVPARGASDFDPPPAALEGRDFDVGIYLAAPYARAVLHVRRPKDVGYRSLPMTPIGGGHHAVRIPADLVVLPRVFYFIEGVDADGHTTFVAGSDDAPFTLDVEGIPKAEAPTLQSRTTVSVLTDWANYDARRADDRAWQTEGLLGMRFVDVGVRALRTGFGVYRGIGGSLEELDELHLEPRKVGLTYGYLEGEFGILPRASIVARAVCGLTRYGVTGGALGLVRIGGDLETNLSLGGEVLGGVGARSITQLELREFPRVPIVLRGEVTNQPAGDLGDSVRGTSVRRGELGLRSIVQVGYELTPGFVVAVRGSYQGRTIYHAGPGFGGAVSYSW